MDPHAVDRPALSRGEKEACLDLKFRVMAETFLKLFELLQEYAPPWYTEQQHYRALAAQQMIKGVDGPPPGVAV